MGYLGGGVTGIIRPPDAPGIRCRKRYYWAVAPEEGVSEICISFGGWRQALLDIFIILARTTSSMEYFRGLNCIYLQSILRRIVN